MTQETAPQEAAGKKEYFTEEEKAEMVRSTHRSDLRRILGMIFVVYGIVVFAVGLIDPAADVAKTTGLPINLWTGGLMFLAGLVFFIWDHFNPVPAEDIIASAEESAAQAAAQGDKAE
ncbi:hypothetical protein [Bifidobacterium platyrrhinorum]|uniref:Uncharacterized protein n=1 Tax=Bifidobacterium platyrrhinorum TaxID=2661628 RepID=A0A6L9STP3_9BIFI|nr:hypothetical protein [Bifidobacterium platyrrhinorum]NEG55854.1 hypothetical protein [Bifidobacterium platyrrhinorum]